MVARSDLVRGMLEIGVVKFGSFLFKRDEGNPNAEPSPIYLNLRKPPKGPLTDGLIRQYVEDLMYPLLERANVRFVAVAGVPEAGDSFAGEIARIVRVQQIFLEKGEKEGKRSIVGIRGDVAIPKGPVLIADDLVTEAHSKKEAAEVLRNAGCTVKDVVVLVDYEQGGREELAEAGLILHEFWRITELLKFYRGAGSIDQEMYERVVDYLARNGRPTKSPA